MIQCVLVPATRRRVAPRGHTAERVRGLVRRALRGGALVVALVLAAVVQLSVLGRLPLPGATPEVVAVLVAAVAVRRGVASGAVAGFAGGLLLDVAPPAAGVLGTAALLLAVVGAGAGVVAERTRAPWPTALLTVVGSAAAVPVLAGLLAAALNRPTGGVAVVLGLVPTQALWALPLALLTLPLLALADRGVAR